MLDLVGVSIFSRSFFFLLVRKKDHQKPIYEIAIRVMFTNKSVRVNVYFQWETAWPNLCGVYEFSTISMAIEKDP